ncbi:MAG: hypothetical protein ABMA01_17845 [Chthoniobacteraceae bacterium]
MNDKLAVVRGGDGLPGGDLTVVLQRLREDNVAAPKQVPDRGTQPRH